LSTTATSTKAVVPVAGLGPRFLPATKAIPKVMLPVVEKPAIQYVVEEAAAAGLHDVTLVTGDSQEAIAEPFSRNYDREKALAAKGNEQGLAAVRAPAELANVRYVRQDHPLGLGHAVLCAAERVGDEPFAVLLGDDLISADDRLLDRMIEARQRFGGSIIALMEGPADQVSAYGVAAFKPTNDPGIVHSPALAEMLESGQA